jgi:glycosyltransferase involved in cell wall biosynthesis
LSSVRNDRRIGRWMERDKVDLVHSPANYGPKVDLPMIVTLHDALNVFPMTQHLRGFGRSPRKVALMLYLGRMTRATLGRAARVITVSEHARRDIAARSRYPLEHIYAIHEAASESFKTIDNQTVLDEVRARLGLAQRIILADGIKNPGAIIDAHARLPDALKRATELVFFSRERTPRPAVAEAMARSGVKFIPQPSTADLVGLMNLAWVFAFPSWYEGFGIPLVEAMQCGTPIVGSSRGSIPEVVGDAGMIFDLDDPLEFVEKLRCVLEDDRLRHELSARALCRSRHFSWRRTAQETLHVYDLAASTGRRSA